MTSNIGALLTVTLEVLPVGLTGLFLAAVLVLGAPIVFAWFVRELLRRPPGDPPTPPGRS